MNATDPTSLTPEERELAQRLAQIAPSGEPSPALDARILAAAHESGVSVSSTSTVPTAILSKSLSKHGRIRRRWPVALGVAASLVLALGVAWRTQPLPEARQVRRSDAAPPMPASMRSTQIPIASPVESKADNTQQTVRSPDALTSHARPASIKTDEPDAVSASPAPAERSIVRDAPSPPDALPAAAKAAAPPALQAPASQASGTMTDGTPVPPPPVPPNAASQANTAAGGGQNRAPQTDSNPLQSAPRNNASGRDEPSDDVPPATADSPAVRDAWLQRIRSLLSDGNITDARTSLHAFIQRYPNYPLPEDLQALARDSTSSP